MKRINEIGITMGLLLKIVGDIKTNNLQSLLQRSQFDGRLLVIHEMLEPRRAAASRLQPGPKREKALEYVVL